MRRPNLVAAPAILSVRRRQGARVDMLLAACIVYNTQYRWYRDALDRSIRP